MAWSAVANIKGPAGSGGGSGAADVLAPSAVSPAGGEVVGEMPLLIAGPFYELYGATQSALQVQVSASAGFSTIAHDSGAQPAGNSYAMPAGVLAVSTAYYWRMRYQSARGMWSDWSAPAAMQTAAVFASYIPTPAATPAAAGDPFEGGYYAGMMWQELAQSGTSTAIATGAKTFAVPDMSGAPIVYGGQLLELRSRANPANKMLCTVTGAAATQLTVNVTEVSGSGSFADWSIMARYRLIAAPRASGETASIKVKNQATALPSSSITSNDGWASTQAMAAADSAAVYPAAHWARGLSIGGRADWYLPAVDELQLLHRTLKPGTNNNATGSMYGFTDPGYRSRGALGFDGVFGKLADGAPAYPASTSTAPAQTAAAAFRTGGGEALDAAVYWSASRYSVAHVLLVMFDGASTGEVSMGYTDSNRRARACRRSII